MLSKMHQNIKNGLDSEPVYKKIPESSNKIL